MRGGAENLVVWLEAHARPATVQNLAKALQRALRDAAGIALPIELLAASDFHLKEFGQCVDNRDADAVQPARRFIDLRVKFAASVQRAENDLQGGLTRKLRVRIDRDAATIVGHGQKTRHRCTRPR